MKIVRKIIEIDEELCDGCGQCVPSCAEGALQIIGGKAKVVTDSYCDGLGACLGECPTGALRIIEREAAEFDEQAAMAFVTKQKGGAALPVDKPGAGCPGAAMAAFKTQGGGCPGSGEATFTQACVDGSNAGPSPSLLGHWPLQIKLIQPDAPFLRDADLVIAADCTAVAYPDFHREFVGGKTVMMGCPKFDGDYAPRLAEVFRHSGVKSVTVVRMEVPCCLGIAEATRRGLAASGREDLELREVIIGRQGAKMTGGLPGF
ncbi:MAG: 4Fe-4S binding protein [Proteobacteria bacterium]|nr:4Fe-4S binding protein [Pseudomonadota bacterium]